MSAESQSFKALMAVGMFFAWLTPTPEEMRGDGFEPDSLDSLPKLGGRAI